MEGNANELLEETFQNIYGNSKQDKPDLKIPENSVAELLQEEEALKNHLDKLKKENFTLQASIKAWQTTLKSKLDEFKEAGLKLDEIHNEIWSERDNFCSKAEKFNNTYGILSDWWAAQMKFVSELENLEKKTSEDEKCRQEIEKFEKEVEELKKEITLLQEGKQIAEVVVHAAADHEFNPVREENPPREDASPEMSEPKKRRHTEEKEERIDISEGKGSGAPTKDDLYSIVDLEKLRKVNRLRKTHFLGKVKKLLTKRSNC